MSDEVKKMSDPSECSHGEVKEYANPAHVEVVGSFRVVDSTGRVFRCAECGESLITDRQLEMYELKAAATILRANLEKSGEAIKYARKALGLSKPQLAELLDVELEVTKMWEVEGAPRVYVIALMGLVLGVMSGFLSTRRLLERASDLKTEQPELVTELSVK